MFGLDFGFNSISTMDFLSCRYFVLISALEFYTLYLFFFVVSLCLRPCFYFFFWFSFVTILHFFFIFFKKHFLTFLYSFCRYLSAPLVLDAYWVNFEVNFETLFFFLVVLETLTNVSLISFFRSFYFDFDGFSWLG